METFKIDKKAIIICEQKNTRNGFKHTATLMVDDYQEAETKICYLNRTWESFEFESVISKLLNNTNYLSKTRKKNFLIKASGRSLKRVTAELKTIGAIAGLGDIFCKDQKDKNDWKSRMIKAGLEGKGLIMPTDWEELDEKTKEERLNKVVAELTK